MNQETLEKLLLEFQNSSVKDTKLKWLIDKCNKRYRKSPVEGEEILSEIFDYLDFKLKKEVKIEND